MDTDNLYNTLAAVCDEVFTKALIPAIVSQAVESKIPSTKITEQSKLADWLYNVLYNVNITSMFNSGVRKRLLDDLHAIVHISEPMYEACFYFHMRIARDKANVVALLSQAHAASIVTQNEYHTFDLVLRDITDDKLVADGMYLLLMVLVAVGVSETATNALMLAYQQAKPQDE